MKTNRDKDIFYKGKHLKQTMAEVEDEIPSTYVNEQKDFEDEETFERQASKRASKRGRILSVGKITAIVLAGVVVTAVVAGVTIYNSKLNKLNYDCTLQAENVATALKEMGETNPEDSIDISGYEVKNSGSTKTSRDISSNKSITNILLIGSDLRIPNTEDRGRADAVMLVSLNKDTGEIKLTSFERAIGMPVEGQSDAKLNDLLNIGDAILIQNTISECFSVKVDGFVHLDYDSFPQIIDAIGGIDLEFTKEEARKFNGRITLDARSEFVAVEGTNHLAGYETLIYCRLRDGDDNWARQGRTRAVVSAAGQRVKNLSLVDLNKLADTILPMIHTNLSKNQISTLLLNAPQFMSMNISQLAVPDKEKIWVYHGENDEAMYGFDFDEETERIQKFLFTSNK